MNKNQWGTKNPFYKHGFSQTRLYKIYYGMIDRCHKPTCRGYQRYGARGIFVCEEWRKSKEAFFAWAITHGYSNNLSIDRIDNQKGYSPENCRWATHKQQANNMTTNRKITINGDTHTISEWASITGIGKTTLRYRIVKGFAENELLKAPNQKKNHRRGMT